MSAVDITLPRLQTDEGFRALVYKDTQGHSTIGYGCNLDAGLSKYAAGQLLWAQAMELQSQLLDFPWFAALDPNRQSVCLEIAFNTGLHGLLGFPHMISALAAHDWETAANECKVQEPELASRYAALAQILLTGNA